MRVRHLDLNRKLYHVRESFRQKRFKKPKGGKARFVDVPEFLVPVFEADIEHLKRAV